MKCAVSNIAWNPDERLGAYRVLADHGFTGLEIAPGLFFHEADDPFEPGAPQAQRALDEMREYGLALVSMQSLLFGVQGAALFGNGDERAALEAGLERAIALAGRFAIPNCVFGSPRQRIVPPEMSDKAAREAALRVFRRLGDAAQAAGTTVAVEANPAAYGGNFLTAPIDAYRFIEEVDHPHVAAILDLGAHHMNGDFAGVPDCIAALIPRLNHVHVSERDLGVAPDPATDLVPVLRALGENGYSKAISIEMRRPEGGLADLDAAASRLAQALRKAAGVEAAHG